MNCLLQRAQEMSVREEAIGDCVAELKATEYELSLHKKDQEDDVDQEYVITYANTVQKGR